VLYSVVGTCKHLGIDPFAYLRAVLPELFMLGEKPAEEALAPWLPEVWQQRTVATANSPAAQEGPPVEAE
jgi:transposase